MDFTALYELYRNITGHDPCGCEILPGGASDRRYCRLWSVSENGEREDEYIGAVGTNKRECKAFVRLDEVFYSAGVNVPKVYAYAPDYLSYLQEDLGDDTLYSMMNSDKISNSEFEDLVKDSISQLVRLQSVPSDKWESLSGYNPFSRRQVMWDLNYFKYEYLKPGAFEIDEEALEDDFERFASDILKYSEGNSGFMIRDFQSRNIMVKNGSAYLIDFQGGRKGPGVYDIVSFLWQAKAGFSEEFRMRMLEDYAEKLAKVRGYSDLNFVSFKHVAMKFALFRTLQVLGAYGLRGLVEKKAYFVESIPFALKNLKELLNAGVADAYPELKRVSTEIIQDGRFVKAKADGLIISVFSFSYKKGYPADYSGNGGGFMFDCRGMHNPGRYEIYKPLTGRDPEVIEFLEDRGEVQNFVDKAISIVTPSVKTYKRRGFSSLQVGFGCTGGRHRSVYCADRFARLLSEQFPGLKVEVKHLEQNF